MGANQQPNNIDKFHHQRQWRPVECGSSAAAGRLVELVPFVWIQLLTLQLVFRFFIELIGVFTAMRNAMQTVVLGCVMFAWGCMRFRDTILEIDKTQFFKAEELTAPAVSRLR